MSADEVRGALSRAVRRVWPHARKASDLPFPEYWRRQAQWLAFHAPRVGERVMDALIGDVVRVAERAVRMGGEPQPWTVPDWQREMWRGAEGGACAFTAPFSGGEGIRYRTGRA